MAKREDITAEQVRAMFAYDPETGVLTSRATGERVGHNHAKGYLGLWIGRLKVGVHAVAWLIMTGEWPREDIDHVDMNKKNNAWVNLRAATRSQNLHNVGLRSDNATGVKGVSFDRTRNKFRAELQIDKKRINLGRFDELNEAASAVRNAAIKYCGEFARVP